MICFADLWSTAPSSCSALFLLFVLRLLVYQPFHVSFFFVLLVSIRRLLWLVDDSFAWIWYIFDTSHSCRQQVPLSEHFLQLCTHLKKDPVFNDPPQLHQQLGHLIIVIDPSLLTFKQLNRQHSAQSFLIQVHLLLFAQVTVHRRQVVLVVNDAWGKRDGFQKFVNTFLQLSLHLFQLHLPEFLFLLNPFVRLAVDAIWPFVV